MSSLKGRRVLVVGAGGLSGQAAMRLLLAEGARVFASDDRPDLSLPEAIAAQENFGGIVSQSLATLDQVSPELLVVSPGVPLSAPILKEAGARGIPLRGENDLGYQLLVARHGRRPLTIAVTGTDGKSTSTALIEHLLVEGCGLRARACGNFGLPLSELALATDPPLDAMVVECSSFQLELTEALHPHVALILNLAEDHLDRYANMDQYLAAKLNVIENMTPSDALIAPSWILSRAQARAVARDEVVPEWIVGPESPPERILFDSTELLPVAEFPLPGGHNRINLGFALLALQFLKGRGLISVDAARLRLALLSFPGLPHRMQRCPGPGFAEFIDDSKATTVQAAAAALRSFPERRVHLLLGGRSKGASFAPLRDAPGARLYAFGEAGTRIAGELGLPEHYPDLESAFEAACQSAENEDNRLRPVVLLSPACASYDAFRSYIERGLRFQELCRLRAARDPVDERRS